MADRKIDNTDFLFGSVLLFMGLFVVIWVAVSVWTNAFAWAAIMAAAMLIYGGVRLQDHAYEAGEGSV